MKKKAHILLAGVIILFFICLIVMIFMILSILGEMFNELALNSL